MENQKYNFPLTMEKASTKHPQTPLFWLDFREVIGIGVLNG